jgi:hypothetical protein
LFAGKQVEFVVVDTRPWTPGIFTSDTALHPTMRSLAPKVCRSPAQRAPNWPFVSPDPCDLRFYEMQDVTLDLAICLFNA